MTHSEHIGTPITGIGSWSDAIASVLMIDGAMVVGALFFLLAILIVDRLEG